MSVSVFYPILFGISCIVFSQLCFFFFFYSADSTCWVYLRSMLFSCYNSQMSPWQWIRIEKHRIEMVTPMGWQQKQAHHINNIFIELLQHLWSRATEVMNTATQMAHMPIWISPKHSEYRENNCFWLINILQHVTMNKKELIEIFKIQSFIDHQLGTYSGNLLVLVAIYSMISAI